MTPGVNPGTTPGVKPGTIPGVNGSVVEPGGVFGFVEVAVGFTDTVETLVGVSTGGCGVEAVGVETDGCTVGVLAGGFAVLLLLLLLAGVDADGCFEDEETGLDGLTGPSPSPFSS